MVATRGLLTATLMWAAFLATLNTTHAAPPLRWKFSQGLTLNVRFEETIDTEATLNDRSVKVAVERAMDMQWKVESVDDAGAARMTQKITRLVLKMKTGGAPSIDYDSQLEEQKSEAGRQIAQSIDALVGAPFELTVSARGQLSEVKLSDQARQAIADRGQARRLGLLAEQFSEPGLRQTLSQALLPLPAGELSPQQTWANERKFETPLGAITMVDKFSYAGSEQRDGKSLEKISSTTTIQLPDAPLALKTQKQSGDSYFDREQGRLVESKLVQEMGTERVVRDRKIGVVTKATVHLTIK